MSGRGIAIRAALAVVMVTTLMALVLVPWTIALAWLTRHSAMPGAALAAMYLMGESALLGLRFNRWARAVFDV